MKIKEVIDRVDEIDEKLNDKKYQDVVFDNVCKKKYKNTSQRYKVIAKLLNEEYSLYGISEVTIWRLLKIKNTSPKTYKDIREGKIKIKTAYEKLFYKAKRKNENDNIDKDCLLDFNKILNQFSTYNKQLENWKMYVDKEPDKQDVLKIDNELYKMRKLLCKMLMYYDDFD